MLMRGDTCVLQATNRWVGDFDSETYTDHAEAGLVRKIIRGGYDQKYAGKLDILVLRFGGIGGTVLRMAKPCKDCQRLLDWVGVRSVRYSNELGDICG